MTRRIVVINPNSSRSVTSAISDSVAAFRNSTLAVDCLTLDEGPPAINGYSDRYFVTGPLKALVAKEEPHADAFVIACFGDPGLLAIREGSKKPVLGIGECSFYTAMALGDRFGILSTSASSIRRHIRYVRELGLSSRLAGDRAINMPMSALEDDPELSRTRLIECGRQLKDDGADVIITGCAGMAAYRDELITTLGVPVVEPTFAGVGLAAAIVRASSSIPNSRES